MIDYQTHHIPILLDAIADFLVEGLQQLPDTAPPGIILDCTLGGGGHAARILEKLKDLSGGMKHRVVGIDRDVEALERNRKKFSAEIEAGRIELVHSSFSEAFEHTGSRPVYGLLADLGISSDQIDSETRGFSFRFPAPLDMRMNTVSGPTLREWLGAVGETELADVIWTFGEERFSRKIARKIVDLRTRGELPSTTSALADAIVSVFPPAMRYKGIHPATRTFQALRIFINDELGELKKLVNEIFPRVEPRGRLAILSFHSLEDRMVKEAFKNKETYELPFKKPVEASDDEVAANPRSRSAKLRIAIRK